MKYTQTILTFTEVYGEVKKETRKAGTSSSAANCGKKQKKWLIRIAICK